MRHLSIEQCLALRNEYRGYYSKMHSNMRKQQQFYDQEITLPKQLKNVQPHVPPTARTIVNNGVDQIMQLGHVISILLWKETQSAKQTASKLKKFDHAYLDNINRTRLRYNVRRMALKHGLLYGEYNIKGPIYVPRLAPTRQPGEDNSEFRNRCDWWENSLDKTFPFVHRLVNPLNMLWDPSPEPDHVFSDYMRKNSEILSQHPEWAEKYNIADSGYSRWTEYYDDLEKKYYVNDAKVYEGENIGGIPYQRGNAGFGNEDDTGSPERAIVGILGPLLKTLKSDISLRTTILYGLQYAVWGRPTISKAPNSAGVYKVSNIPGETSQIDDAYNYRNLAPNQLSPETYRIMGLLDQDIQQVLPKSSYGSLPKGMTSGSMMTSSIIQGRASLTELKSQWELTASNMCNRMHLLVKYVVQEPVGILGTLATGGSSIMKLTPAQLHPDVQVANVMLDPMSPEEKDNRINLGILMLRSGAASMETIMENYFGLDYQVESQRMAIESILKNPQVQQKFGEVALEQAGMMEVMDILKENGMQIPDQGEAFDQISNLRRAQDGMQEMYRPDDYYHNRMGPGNTVYQLPERGTYGEGENPNDNFRG